jgi:1-deoxy-D-xylulose-5-phosphate synthase
MAFEALNNAGDMDVDLLVVLNDNEMSISPPVGALNKYLARLMSGRVYAKARGLSERMLGELARRAEEHVKGMVTPGTMFEEFGFNYIGPIDGHDLDALIPTLNNIRHLRGPQFLHVVTRKGQGYKLAEADPVLYHGVSKFDHTNGIVGGKSGGKQTYTQIFGDWICDMAEIDSRLVGITPAMREGSGLVNFASRFPERYFDVGIAEQHALTFAAGLACEGCKPVVAIYSTFLQRAYDQLIHDVQIQNLPIVLAIDRAGLVGADGATHNGSFDLTYLRCLPNMTVMTPADENECRQMLYTAFCMNSPVAVRYPRGTGPGAAIEREMKAVPLGKGEIRRQTGLANGHGRVAILAFGPMLQPALQAAEAVDATVANMRFVKPLDEALVLDVARSHDLLVTVEENVVMGGAGGAVLEALERHRVCTEVLQLGLPDRFVDQGDPGIQLASCGLTADGIVQSIRTRLAG